MSLPAWECGLKLLFDTTQPADTVTPRVGVWIETSLYFASAFKYESLPAWECGLKLMYISCSIRRNCHSPRGSVD